MTKLLANIALLNPGRAAESIRKRQCPGHHCRVSAKQSTLHLVLCFLLACCGVGAFAAELDFHGGEYFVVQDAQKDNAKSAGSIEQTELSVAAASEHPVTPKDTLVQYLSAYLYNARNGSSMIDGRAFYESYAVEQTVLLDGSLANDGDILVWRWTSFLSGYQEQSRYLTWDDARGCWQPSPASDNTTCQNFIEAGVSSNPQQSVGSWQVELVYNNSVIYTKAYEVVGSTLEAVGGTNISGQLNTVANNPLRAKLLHFGGSPISGATLTFVMNSTNGSGLVSSPSAPPSGSSVLSAVTDADGVAQVYVSFGSTEGEATITAVSNDAPLNPPEYASYPTFTARALNSASEEVAGLDVDKNLGTLPDHGCAGNPINLVSGNKYQQESDLNGHSAAALHFIRFYNSQDQSISAMGKGWRHSYERAITFATEGKGRNAISRAFLKRPSGQVLTLLDTSAGWVGDADVYFELHKQGGTWQLITDQDSVELYDGKGKLLSITDVSGNTQLLSYDKTKRLYQVTSDSGEALEFSYDADGLLISADYWASNASPTGGESRVWLYDYTDGRLTQLTNPDSSIRTYHYENISYPGLLTGITDERGVRYVSWEYDVNGYATSSYHGTGAERVDVVYELDGERTVTDSLGNVAAYGAAAQLGQGLVTDTQGPTCTTGDNSLAAYNYDPLTNDKLSETIDGSTTEYGSYDASGNPGYQVEAVGTQSERRADYTYDPRFHSKITSITEPSIHAGESKVTTMEYDDYGNLIRRTVDGFKPDGTPVSRTATFAYNGPYGQISQIDGPRTDVSDITTFEYYADDPALYQHQGMLLRVTGPEGIVQRDNLQYNSQRQLIAETRPNGLLVTYDWEPNTDRMAAITETVGTESRTTSWTYLLTGEVETFTQPDGSTLSYEYDEARRLVRVVDTLGNSIDYNLDTEGNILNESTYDPDSLLAKSITRSFDVYNRLDVITQANESLDYDYAADGTLAREVNGNAVETQYSYDELKRLTTTLGDAVGSDPATTASQTDLDYDSQNNLAAVTDPLASVTTDSYDDLGNRVSRVSPDTGTTTFNYDAAGNRTQASDAKGQHFFYTYDALNRPTLIDAPGGDDDIVYHYDSCANGLGKLCDLARGANTTAYAYNGFGNVLSMDQGVQTDSTPVASGLGISYDSAGRIQGVAYPGNTSITYGYDAMGKVNQLTLNRNGLSTELISNVAYQAFGPLKALTRGNGLTKSIDRDSASRITAINDPVYDAAFSYDANGNILYQSRNIGDLNTGYDALDKLTTATGPLDSYAYGYDRNANRLTDSLNGTSTNYYYEASSNRLTQTGLDPVILDANGNTTQLRGMTLDYSPDNRLIAANDSTYGYNGSGERVLKTTASKTTVYHYGLQGQLMAELNDSGQLEKAYIYLNGQPFAVLDYATAPSGVLYYSHNDHLGTPQGLTNASGTIVWLADYSPFGLAAVNDNPDLDGNPVTFNLRFAGQYFDGESGLHYNYFRDYDPTTGRYVQSDPIGLGGGINTYTYVYNNPLIYTDTDGLRVRPSRGFGSGGTNGGAGGGYGQTIGNGYYNPHGRYMPPSIPVYRPPIRPLNIPSILFPNNNREQESLRRLMELYEHLMADEIKAQIRCQLDPSTCKNDEDNNYCPIGS